ncbi:MAG: glutathione S-transferase family protein [Pseudomonadota bacterium]|nr:glutathione S-transferase family protein [Pseudomonadota bacterium]
MSATLFGAPLSPFVRKIRIALAEKNLDYSLVPLDPNEKTPELLAVNPLGRVPAYRDDRGTLADSAVIAQYLERRYPEPSLYAADDHEFARVLWFEKYADYELSGCCTFGVFRQRLIMPLLGQAGDSTLVDSVLAERLPRHFDYLEAELDGRPHLAADRLTMADIAVASQCCNLIHGGESVDAARWPALAELVEGVRSRPSCAACLEQEVGVVERIRARIARGTRVSGA